MMLASAAAQAQMTGTDASPGDTCSPTGAVAFNANPGGDGAYILTCEEQDYGGGSGSGSWQPLVLAADPTQAQQVATRKYTDDTIPGESCLAGGPVDCPDIGDECNDGTIFVGWHPTEAAPMFMQPSDAATSATWSSESVNSGATSDVDGSANQDWVESNKTITDYDAFNECKLENDSASYGHTDWYLPSRIEMAHLRWYRDTIDAGPATAFVTSDAYWTSSEYTSDNTKATYQSFNGDYIHNLGTAKTNTNHIRCIRRPTSPMGSGNICRRMGPTDCPAIGDACDDGSLFVGWHPGLHEPLFLHPDYQGDLAWSTENVNTGATDLLDGSANQAWIEANKTLSDYPAFEACDTLNGTPADNLGHTDWYLPSAGEIFMIWGSRANINMTTGSLSSLSHTSTEYSSVHSNIFDWTGIFNLDKSRTDEVKCIRRGL